MTETGALIRERQTNDLDAAARTLVAVHASDGYPVEGVADPTAWLQPPTLIRAWVADLDGEIVGHVLITAPTSGDDAVRVWREQNPQASDNLAALGRLFVLSTARGRSVGEHLVRAVMAYASAHDLRLLLDVMDKDIAAIRLYERLGWQRIGTAAHRFGDGQQITAFCYAAPIQ